MQFEAKPTYRVHLVLNRAQDVGVSLAYPPETLHPALPVKAAGIPDALKCLRAAIQTGLRRLAERRRGSLPEQTVKNYALKPDGARQNPIRAAVELFGSKPPETPTCYVAAPSAVV